MSATPEPFHLAVDDAAIADLRERLRHTRFPDQAPGEPWAYGTDLDYLRGLVAYWRDGFDWRAQEVALNAFPQYKLGLGGTDVHFLHVPGNGPAPCPLLLLHGWPGSVFEFLDMIPRLTDPAHFGGDAKDAFTIIAPSLPGYGLSFMPGQPRFGIEEIADLMAELMPALGYPRFAVQGGDWGAFIASRMGCVHAHKLLGLHVNLLAVRRERDAPTATAEEEKYYEQLAEWLREGTGYQWIQGHAAADPGLCADRLAGRARGVDRRQVPRLVRLRRRCRERDRPRPHAGEYQPLLVHRRDRLVLLSVLRPHAPALALARTGHRAGRLRRIPGRDPAPAEESRRTCLHRHPAVDRDAAGRPFRGDGTARRTGARDPRILPPAPQQRLRSRAA
jgi:pimeloyl-ACP methyl ester carboxylesterase